MAESLDHDKYNLEKNTKNYSYYYDKPTLDMIKNRYEILNIIRIKIDIILKKIRLLIKLYETTDIKALEIVKTL